MTATRQKLYFGFLKRNGKVVGHALSTKPTTFSTHQSGDDRDDDEHATKTPAAEPTTNNFEAVFKSFVSIIESYLRFMPFTLAIAPELARAIAEEQIFDFIKNNGSKRDDLTIDTVDVYELDRNLFGEIRYRTEHVKAAYAGSRLLPGVMIVGLISAFDGFLASLLKVVISKHEEIVLTSQKQLTFRELSEFSSIEEARSTIIDREVEAVIRKSHHEQFE
jgi:hypothetical protein